MKMIVFSILYLGWLENLFAQPLPPPNPVPVDSGLGLLLIGGVYYVWKRRKKDV